MADDTYYRQHAGPVTFPRSSQDLRSTANCPACFAALTSTVCAACGLDLGHPDAALLYERSVAAASALDERIEIIGRMRYEAGKRVAAAAMASAGAAASIREPADAGALLNERENDGTDAAVLLNQREKDAADEGALLNQREKDAAAPRRSSVQVTLLIVGVSLLSVAAIFFLVYAFINFGIVWRSVIIGAITVAAFVVASLLRRRNLTATAEGIAAFAVVLVYLDAYALRANDLFGAEKANASIYWGAVLVLAAAGFVVWHRLSALRIPSIAGFASFAPGVGLLVGGLSRDLESGTTSFLAFCAIAAAGLVHRWAARPEHPATAERMIVLATTVLALLAALGVSIAVGRGQDWAPAIAAIVVAVVAAMHVAALLLGRTATAGDRLFAGIVGGIGGVAAAGAVSFAAIRIGDERFGLLWPGIAAVAVALALDLGARRAGVGILRTPLAVARWSAAGVALLALAWPAILALASTVTAVRTAIPAWSHEPADAVGDLSDPTLWAVGAIAAVTAIAALVWALTRTLATPRRSTVVLAATSFALVAAAPELRTQWQVFGAWLLLSVVCLIVLVLVRRSESVRSHHRAVLVAAMVASGLLGYLLGWATTTTWWIGTLVVIGILVTSRLLMTSAGAKAALLGTGVAVALASVGSVADQLTLNVDTDLGVRLTDRFVLTALAAILVLLIAAIPLRPARALDRRVVFWVGAAASVIAVPAATVLVNALPASSLPTLLLPEYGTSLGLAVALLVAVCLWVAHPGNRSLRPERTLAAIAATPALYLALTALARVLNLPELATNVAPVTAAVLGAAGSLAITLLRPTAAPRWARELGVALVGVPAVIAAVLRNDGLTWLVLILAAVAVLLLAIDRDGLFSSRSVRHHLGWLALALAVAGFWWRLSGDKIADLYLYVVPVTLVLMLVAELITSTARREEPPRDSKAGPLVTLGAILVSILPLGVDAATGSPVQALWIFGISAVLLLVGSAIVGGPRRQWNADACALGGAIGVLVVAVGRAVLLPTTAIERDAWLAGAFLALMVAAFLQARPHPAGNERVRAIGSQALGLVAMTAVLALEVAAFTPDAAGGIRAFALVLLWCALHVVAYLVDHAPLTRLVAWVAIGFAVATAGAAIATDALHPVELATAPVALALLATGTIHLATVPAARSWPWLGPGTALLLVPSLLATLDERPLWRLVGLGVVGVAVIVLAVVRRLQAPFVLGVVVVLIHGIATFLPQLRAAYEFLPWWLWLGAGGVLLIVLAARYEQRIRNLKSVAMKFAALR